MPRPPQLAPQHPPVFSMSMLSVTLVTLMLVRAQPRRDRFYASNPILPSVRFPPRRACVCLSVCVCVCVRMISYRS